ncbi:hypothetical protein ANCDUO_24876, partial [Ancylostoma duodenale]
MSFLFEACDSVDHNLFLDVFSKSVLFPKVRAEQFVIDICGYGLSKISPSTFRDTLLPNIKKSLLRSPEVAAFGIVKAIESAAFPLDEYITDLLKGLGAAKSSEQRVALLEGVAKCAGAKNANSEALEKIASGVVTKTTSPDKEGDMKSLPADCEKQLWQELETVSKEPLQFISLAALLLKTCDSGTPNHTKVWGKVTTYDSVLKPGSYPPLLLKSLTILLFWPDWQVRKRASLAVERILIIEESHFAEALADVIFTETINGFVDQ